MPDSETPDHEATRSPGNAGPGGSTPEHDARRARVEHLAQALGAHDDLPIDPDLDPDDRGEPSATHRPTPGGGRHRAHPQILGLIFVGGALGTVARYGVERAWPAAAGGFPTATFVINTSGAFLLGLVLTVLIERLTHRGRRLRPFLATGILGGWTTYSTLVDESVTLAKGGHVAMAAGYMALTLLCGVTSVALGIALGRSRALRPVAASVDVLDDATETLVAER